MTPFTCLATRGQRWKILLPTASSINRERGLNCRAASALIRRQWDENTSQRDTATEPYETVSLNGSRFKGNLRYPRKNAEVSAATLWSAIGGKFGAMSLQAFFTIAATLSVGVLVAFVVCKIWVSIKGESSTALLAAHADTRAPGDSG